MSDKEPDINDDMNKMITAMAQRMAIDSFKSEYGDTPETAEIINRLKAVESGEHVDAWAECPCADCLAHNEAADILDAYPDNSLTRAQAIAVIAKGELNDEKTAVDQFDIFVELGIFTFTDVDFSTKQIKLDTT